VRALKTHTLRGLLPVCIGTRLEPLEERPDPGRVGAEVAPTHARHGTDVYPNAGLSRAHPDDDIVLEAEPQRRRGRFDTPRPGVNRETLYGAASTFLMMSAMRFKYSS